MKFIRYVFLVLVFTSCLTRSDDVNQTIEVPKSDVPDVSFCDLAASPKQYTDKKIRLKGIFILRFEASSFYSLSCNAEKPITLFYEKETPCSEKSEIEDWDWSSVMVDRAHVVILIGKLNGEMKKSKTTNFPSDYYEFQVDCFERIKELGWLPLNPSNSVKRKLEDFEKSEN